MSGHNTKESHWYLYLVRCSDNSLYTGITTNVERRFKEHQAGGKRSARYLRGRGPLLLAFSCSLENRSQALRLEYAIKQLGKAQKEQIISGALAVPSLLDKLSE